MRSYADRRRVYRRKPGFPVERQKFWPGLAIEAEIFAAGPHRLVRSPVQHGTGKSAAGKPPCDCKPVDIQGLTEAGLGPEHNILVVKIHAGAEFAVHMGDHQFAGLCDTRQLFARCFLLAPERFPAIDQPLRGFPDQCVNLGKGFDSRAPNLQTQAWVSSQAP